MKPGPGAVAAGLSVFLVATATASAQTASAQTQPQADTSASGIQHLAFGIQQTQLPPQSPLPSRPLVVPVLTPDALSDDQQLMLLRQWTHDYQDWKAWYLQWRNQPE